MEVAAKVVDPVEVIGMRMAVEHRIDVLDARGDHLLAEIRTGIDDDGRRTAVRRELLHEEGRACPAVAWIVRVAGAPVAIDARNPGRRGASEDRVSATVEHAPQSLGILLNIRKAFSVVIRAISSTPIPTVSARTSAVLTT